MRLQVASPSALAVDHPWILIVPDVIRGDILEWLWLRAVRGPFSTWRLFSLVFVLVPGHLSAPGVDFLDRILAFTSPLLLVPVSIRSPSRSFIGICLDLGGCGRGSSLVIGLGTEPQVRVLRVSSESSHDADPLLGFFVPFRFFVDLVIFPTSSIFPGDF